MPDPAKHSQKTNGAATAPSPSYARPLPHLAPSLRPLSPSLPLCSPSLSPFSQAELINSIDPRSTRACRYPDCAFVAQPACMVRDMGRAPCGERRAHALLTTYARARVRCIDHRARPLRAPPPGNRPRTVHLPGTSATRGKPRCDPLRPRVSAACRAPPRACTRARAHAS